MLLAKDSVRDFMLDSNVEPLIATQVAHSLDGTLSTGVAEIDGFIRFDGAVKAEQWPAISQQLRGVPASMIVIDDIPSASRDTIEFTVTVREGSMSEADTSATLSNLQNTFAEDDDDGESAFVDDDVVEEDN